MFEMELQRLQDYIEIHPSLSARYNMSNQDKEKQSDDSLEQKQKNNDPNQDIEPQRETDSKPQESNRE